MATILIVEDDLAIRTLLKAELEGDYSIKEATNGEEALNELYKTEINLIITDVMMPKMDGFEFVKELRRNNFTQPVLMLTAKTTITDKTEGFTLGADDYLTKPVDYDELKLHVIALLRRARISTAKKLTIGKTVLDEETLTIQFNGQTTELPKKEFQLLFKLFSYPNKVFTQGQLLDDIWGRDNFSGEETVKTHISRIRKVIKDNPDLKITTVRGLGYKGEIND